MGEPKTRPTMKLSVVFTATVILCLTYSLFAHAGMVETAGGGQKDCMTTDLPANVWSLVSYDNIGQPCASKPDADSTVGCTANGVEASANWDWQVKGNLHISANVAPNSAYVQVALFSGGGGGVCHGGTSDFPTCDNPAYHYLEESNL